MRHVPKGIRDKAWGECPLDNLTGCQTWELDSILGTLVVEGEKQLSLVILGPTLGLHEHKSEVRGFHEEFRAWVATTRLLHKEFKNVWQYKMFIPITHFLWLAQYTISKSSHVLYCIYIKLILEGKQISLYRITRECQYNQWTIGFKENSSQCLAFANWHTG